MRQPTNNQNTKLFEPPQKSIPMVSINCFVTDHAPTIIEIRCIMNNTESRKKEKTHNNNLGSSEHSGSVVPEHEQDNGRQPRNRTIKLPFITSRCLLAGWLTQNYKKARPKHKKPATSTHRICHHRCDIHHHHPQQQQQVSYILNDKKLFINLFYYMMRCCGRCTTTAADADDENYEIELSFAKYH